MRLAFTFIGCNGLVHRGRQRPRCRDHPPITIVAKPAMKTDYDVIIIGSGAGGGTLAHRLAPSGKSILILERGGWLKREPENWSAEAVFKDNRYVSPDIWHHDSNGKPFQPGTYHYVGGATKMYGAALYRLRERDFTPLQHEDGLSPGWPLGYSDFEPYYLQAENLYQVHGTRGEDPTEPPPAGRIPFRRSRMSLASSSFPTTSKKRATIRSTRPVASCSTRRTCLTAVVCAAWTATVSPAWFMPSRTPRCSRCARAGTPQRRPADPREGHQTQYQRRGHRSHRGHGRAGR